MTETHKFVYNYYVLNVNQLTGCQATMLVAGGGAPRFPRARVPSCQAKPSYPRIIKFTLS